MIWTLFLIFVLAVVLIIFHRKNNDDSRAPPGPTPWPLVGNFLLLLGRNNLEVFGELQQRFGPVVLLNILGTKVLLLNSWDAIRDAFVKHGDVFNNKPTNTLTSHINKNTGIIASNGHVWREHRRFTTLWLRNLGMGKRTIETSIKTEIAELCAAIEDLAGSPFDPRDLIFPSVLNVTWALVAGQRFCLDDPHLNHLMNLLQESMRLGVQSGLLNFLPSLRHVPFLGAPYWKMKANLKSLYEFLDSIIEEQKQTLDSNSDSSDLLREYIKEHKNQTLINNSEDVYSIEQIRRVLTDLFVAGSETTVTTLCWALLLLIRDPNIQSSIQDDIDRCFGTARLPKLDDKLKMPYIEAILAEMQRFSRIVPLVSHSTATEAEFNGYTIPEGTIVLGNLWSVMRDPTIWIDAEKFDPNRFLDSSGQFFKPDYFIPFSIGKRACLGKSLAESELFLYFTTLLQKFSFYPAGDELPSMEPVPGITMSPKPFKLIAKVR